MSTYASSPLAGDAQSTGRRLPRVIHHQRQHLFDGGAHAHRKSAADDAVADI